MSFLRISSSWHHLLVVVSLKYHDPRKSICFSLKAVDAMQKDSIIRPVLRCLLEVWLPMIVCRRLSGRRNEGRCLKKMRAWRMASGYCLQICDFRVPVRPQIFASGVSTTVGWFGKTRMEIPWIPYTENSWNSVLELCENNLYLCRKHWDANECMMTASRE